MLNFLQEYLFLKFTCVNLLEENARKEEVINSLKNLYSERIKSRRILETIKSAASLIRILEKRLCLSITNIEPFSVIIKQIDGPESLFQRILDYKECLKHTAPPRPNYYELSKKTIKKQIDQKEEKLSSNLPDELIYETLSESIGTSWKTMARYLSIPEGTIDTLDREYDTNMVMIVQNILNTYRRKNPKLWKYGLCEALEKSRRSDVKKSIENIIHNHE